MVLKLSESFCRLQRCYWTEDIIVTNNRANRILCCLSYMWQLLICEELTWYCMTLSLSLTLYVTDDCKQCLMSLVTVSLLAGARTKLLGLWCKKRLTEADTPTIRLGATPSELTSADLHHPPYFYRPDALPAAQPTASKHWRQLACQYLCQLSSETNGGRKSTKTITG